MNALSLQFARDNGCLKPSPAQLVAFEAIRQHGIREARKAHYDRKKVADEIKAEPGLFFAMIHPAQSADEAIDDANNYLVRLRNMPTHRRQAVAGVARKVKAIRVYARFFRRFGEALMAREAA